MEVAGCRRCYLKESCFKIRCFCGSVRMSDVERRTGAHGQGGKEGGGAAHQMAGLVAMKPDSSDPLQMTLLWVLVICDLAHICLEPLQPS